MPLRFRVLALIAFALCCGRASAAPTVVQYRSSFCTGCLTISLAYSSSTTAGNALMVWTLEDNAVAQVPTCCGAGSPDTWSNGCLSCGTQVGSPSFFYVCNTMGGAQTIQVVSHSSANSMHIILEEVAGVNKTGCLDTIGQRNSATPSSVTTGATGCPPNGCGGPSVSSAVEYCGAYFASWNLNATFTAGTGYTQVEQVNDGGGNDSSMLEDNNTRAGLSGAQTATSTNTAGGTGMDGIIACFKGLSNPRHKSTIY